MTQFTKNEFVLCIKCDKLILSPIKCSILKCTLCDNLIYSNSITKKTKIKTQKLISKKLLKFVLLNEQCLKEENKQKHNAKLMKSVEHLVPKSFEEIQKNSEYNVAKTMITTLFKSQ